MGRIVVKATIENGTDASSKIVCDALVDTGAAYLTLPNAWRSQLGQLTTLDTVEVETADQSVVTGEICGPVVLRFGRFRPVFAEALFIEMEPANGRYEALIGYVPLEQAQAVVDLSGHRLAKVDHVDLKRGRSEAVLRSTVNRLEGDPCSNPYNSGPRSRTACVGSRRPTRRKSSSRPIVNSQPGRPQTNC